MYTPLTQMGMNFLMNGGALVPMDGKAGVLPGSLPDGAISRAYVVDMASFGLQFYAAIRRLMPASWVATWTATLLAQETSVLGSCVETVHISNLLRQAINTRSSFSNILSVVGNGAGLATWAASNLCNVLPDFCMPSNSQSVSISQSGEQADPTELSINTQAGELILRPLQDPYVWLNGLSPKPDEKQTPAPAIALAWAKHPGRNCYWENHGAEEVDYPWGKAVDKVKTLHACQAACVEAADFGCHGVLFQAATGNCYRKKDIVVEKCVRDESVDLYVRPSATVFVDRLE